MNEIPEFPFWCLNIRVHFDFREPKNGDYKETEKNNITLQKYWYSQNPIRETRVLKLVFITIPYLKFWAQHAPPGYFGISELGNLCIPTLDCAAKNSWRFFQISYPWIETKFHTFRKIEPGVYFLKNSWRFFENTYIPGLNLSFICLWYIFENCWRFFKNLQLD